MTTGICAPARRGVASPAVLQFGDSPATSTLAKLNEGGVVNTAILVKICNALNCGLEDIVEYHPAGMAKKPKRKIENER